MPIDTAEKRKSAAVVHRRYTRGPGVTPNAGKDQEWRQEVAYSYSGILAGGAVAVASGDFPRSSFDEERQVVLYRRLERIKEICAQRRELQRLMQEG